MSRAGSVMATAMVASLGACDLRVFNPGPIADSELDNPAAHEALVNGMGRALSRAVGYIAYTGAVATVELVSAGQRNPATFGITIKQSAGILDPDWEESNDHWKYGQQARWVAEDGARRIRDVLGADASKSSRLAQALVYAGFANRLLGENMCDAVIDGGPVEPRSEYFERAEAAFTEAIAIAQVAGDAASVRAATAGRASVRAWMNDWPEAAADAQEIPLTFAFRVLYSGVESEQYNRLFAGNATVSRAHSVVGTFFETYYRTTGDPRTPWKTNPSFPTGTAGVPWLFQVKYEVANAPINLATGREMRLIVAESLLRSGRWQEALTTINSLRTAPGLLPWSASGVAGTWAVLARERGIELWLEGRRLGDIFRWKAGEVPVSFPETEGRAACFPIGVSETDANPNL